jgi:uncharacterized protein (TIGR00369 family)
MLGAMSVLDTDQLHALVPFAATLGLRVAEATKDVVRVEMDFRPDLCTSATTIHGGALMSLADTAGAIVAILNLPEGSTGTTTLESKTNLLAAVREGTVVATSAPLRVGRSVIVVETELHLGDRLVSKTTQTQMVLRRP